MRRVSSSRPTWKKVPARHTSAQALKPSRARLDHQQHADETRAHRRPSAQRPARSCSTKTT
jgi:hypothetical protein